MAGLFFIRSQTHSRSWPRLRSYGAILECAALIWTAPPLAIHGFTNGVAALFVCESVVFGKQSAATNAKFTQFYEAAQSKAQFLGRFTA